MVGYKVVVDRTVAGKNRVKANIANVRTACDTLSTL